MTTEKTTHAISNLKVVDPGFWYVMKWTDWNSEILLALFGALDPHLLRGMKQFIFHIHVLVSCSFLLNEAHNTRRNYFQVAGLVEAICGY